MKNQKKKIEEISKIIDSFQKRINNASPSDAALFASEISEAKRYLNSARERLKNNDISRALEYISSAENALMEL